jgi:adenylosuccinate lyase
LLPEAFLIADEMLVVATRILAGLQVNQAAMQRNLSDYGPFAALERLLVRLAKTGADRQVMHERLRQHALAAWEAIRQGHPNPLNDLIGADVEIRRYLPGVDFSTSMDAVQYLGDAPQRARLLAAELQGALQRN